MSKPICKKVIAQCKHCVIKVVAGHCYDEVRCNDCNAYLGEPYQLGINDENPIQTTPTANPHQA